MKWFLLFFISLQVLAGPHQTMVRNTERNYDFPIDVITFQQINQVLERINEGNFPKDFTVNGCEARAHQTWNYFNMEGHSTGKIIISVLDENGKVNHDKRLKFRQNRWSWHIANLVAIEKGDQVEFRVIDYSIADHAMTIKTFVNTLIAEEVLPSNVPYSVSYCPGNCYFELNRFNSPDELSTFREWNIHDSEVKLQVMREFMDSKNSDFSLEDQNLYYHQRLFELTGNEFFKPSKS